MSAQPSKYANNTTLIELSQRFGSQAPAQSDTEEIPQFVTRETFEAMLAEMNLEIARLRRTVAQLCQTTGICER